MHVELFWGCIEFAQLMYSYATGLKSWREDWGELKGSVGEWKKTEELW